MDADALRKAIHSTPVGIAIHNLLFNHAYDVATQRYARPADVSDGFARAVARLDDGGEHVHQAIALASLYAEGSKRQADALRAQADDMESDAQNYGRIARVLEVHMEERRERG